MFRPLKESTDKTSILKSVVRGPCYLFGVVLLLFSTVLILVAMFTNNWRKSSNTSSGEYYTSGLWFTCRYVHPSWLTNTDVYCSSSNFSSIKWIYAAQIFYTFAAALNLFCLFTTIFGLCRDCGKRILTIPSLVMWILLVSSMFQLIGIAVYGGKGIGDYSKFEPDYSIILAAVALSLNFFCVILFLIEIFIKSLKKNEKPRRR